MVRRFSRKESRNSNTVTKAFSIKVKRFSETCDECPTNTEEEKPTEETKTTDEPAPAAPAPAVAEESVKQKSETPDVFDGETKKESEEPKAEESPLGEPPAEPPLLSPSATAEGSILVEDNPLNEDNYTEVPETEVVQQFSQKPKAAILPSNPFGNYGRESFSCLFDKK